MTRLIDADALKEVIFGNSYILRDSINSMNFGMFCDGIEQAIGEAPTIDAVPVVRCKDCKHCEYASNRIPTEQAWVCYKLGIDVEQDWFCAVGERKDDE